MRCYYFRCLVLRLLIAVQLNFAIRSRGVAQVSGILQLFWTATQESSTFPKAQSPSTFKLSTSAMAGWSTRIGRTTLQRLGYCEGLLSWFHTTPIHSCGPTQKSVVRKRASQILLMLARFRLRKVAPQREPLSQRGWVWLCDLRDTCALAQLTDFRLYGNYRRPQDLWTLQFCSSQTNLLPRKATHRFLWGM